MSDEKSDCLSHHSSLITHHSPLITMPIVLLILEFLGTTELMVIALVALIIFGPRKLPQIGRTVGKSIAEFKRASDDFKRTWEYEVEIEQRRPALDAPQAPGRRPPPSILPPYPRRARAPRSSPRARRRTTSAARR